MSTQIVAYDDGRHREQVVRLWEDVFGYETARNAPALVIDRKIAVSDGLFFVAVHGDRVVGTAMAGYDGHRGWIYSMAVRPEWRGRGLGTDLLSAAEAQLIERGCVKINLQILEENREVRAFYEANGYAVEPRISMGKETL